MTNTALLIIDVQNGMFTHAEQPHEGTAMLERISDLVARARAAQVSVIFVQHDGGTGHPLEKPLAGWHIHPATGYRDGDLVVEKRNCDSFQDTRLDALLKAQHVTTLVVAGMATDYCVDTTCRRAYSLGYAVILARDAHSTFAHGDLSAAQIVAHHNAILGSEFATTRATADIDFQHS